MWVKITNCTVLTGGGKIPRRIRRNQNVKVLIPDTLLEKYDFDGLLDKMRYRDHEFRGDGREFIVTNESKMCKL